MNAWQVLQQIQWLLQQEEWTTDVAVFDSASVVVTVTPEAEAAANLSFPVALIRPLGGIADGGHDGELEEMLDQDVAIRVISAVKGDRMGQAALLGANREGQDATPGRGLLEIEEKLFDALLDADDDLGFRIAMRATGAAQAQPTSGLTYMVWRDYTFRARVTVDRFYHPPYGLSATVSGGVVLGWSLPPSRFDTSKMVLRRASGGTAPASATAGTGVTLASDLATSKTDSPGSGTWSYALFAEYDEWHDATNLRYSAAVVAEGVVVP